MSVKGLPGVPHLDPTSQHQTAASSASGSFSYSFETSGYPRSLFFLFWSLTLFAVILLVVGSLETARRVLAGVNDVGR